MNRAALALLAGAIVEEPPQLGERGFVVRDSVHEAVDRGRSMRGDEAPERLRDDGRHDTLARDGGAIAHVQMRTALVAFGDETLLEHPAQFGEDRRIRQLLVFREPAMQISDRLRATCPQKLEDRRLPGSQRPAEIGFFLGAHTRSRVYYAPSYTANIRSACHDVLQGGHYRT